MGANWSDEITPIEGNAYVAYGYDCEEAAGNLTTLLRYYGYGAVRIENNDKSLYYVWHNDKKLYLVWNKSNNIWRCYVPL